MNIKYLAATAVIAIIAQACTDGCSCSRQEVTPADSIAADSVPADSIVRHDSVAQPQEPTRTITGVAVDGGMNSIDLVVGKDTLSFDFPDLPYHVTWTTGDTMTIVIDTATDSVMSLKPAH